MCRRCRRDGLGWDGGWVRRVGGCVLGGMVDGCDVSGVV